MPLDEPDQLAAPLPGRQERRRILMVSVAVLVVATLTTAAIGIFVMYRSAFDRTLQRLEDVAVEHARLIEAVGQFDAQHSPEYPGGPAQATLSQVLRANEHFPGFGETGELTLARRDGDRIVFLMTRQRHGEVTRAGVPWTASAAEPMRRALQGQSGNLIGKDYRGEPVLAVHEPVGIHGWGVVAKIDMAEIRRSLIPAALATAGLGSIVIALGVLALFGVAAPIIGRLDLRTRELQSESEERARAQKELADARSLLLTSLGSSTSVLREADETRDWAPPYFRAVVMDYDGTLTVSGRPSEDLLAALEEVRARGLRLVLVTGRSMPSLEAVFPDVNRWFDLIVAENGAMLFRQGIARGLASPVPTTMEDALRRRNVRVERGQVLMACGSKHDRVVLEEISRLHLDCQIIRNRTRIMILPAGISKGTGVERALDALRVSPHNAIAIGDAENDLSMFEVCELGVAVTNALRPVKSAADIVLDRPAGEGVLDFLESPLLRGQEFLEPKRWQILLGHSPEGTPVTLPASGQNILVTGGSGGGKSYSAGLVAEQLIELGYSVCVLDPEGDYAGLGRFREVILVGGQEPLPRPEQLGQIVQHRFESVVVDLSQHPPGERMTYISEALQVLKAQRALSGCPHWIIVDEAHGSLGTSPATRFVETGDKGYCLVTYLPSALQRTVPITFDSVIVLPRGAHAGEVAKTVEAIAKIPRDAVDRFLTHGAQPGDALLIRVASQDVETLTLAPRTLEHVRHQHKYSHGEVSPEYRFLFRTSAGLNGATAGNVVELYRELDRGDLAIFVHHSIGHDFSRWIEEVLHDKELSRQVHDIEARTDDRASVHEVELMRKQMLDAIRTRYLALGRVEI